jgi:hypothetical protein
MAGSMSARILRLPVTASGRQLLRESVLERGGCWDFPDGSAAETIDWDKLVVDIARDLEALEVARREGRYPFDRRGRR